MKIVVALLFLGLLIFIHEFGHFSVAKALRIGVRTLSLGFGRRLFGFRIGETDYRLSLIPFGGYVRLQGADPFQQDDEPDDVALPESRSILRRPAWQRILVSAGGPAFNLVLPFFIFMGLYLAGQPEPASVAGTIVRGSAAMEAGILAGDRVLAVAGRTVETWEEMSEAFSTLGLDASGVSIRITGTRGERELRLGPPRPRADSRRLLPEHFGLRAEVADTEVGVDDPSSPAGRAGLASGDRVLRVNGSEVADWLALCDALAESGARAELMWTSGKEEKSAVLELPEASPESGASFHLDAASPWGLASSTLFVESVAEGSPAELAGVLPGDHLLAIDGEPVGSWHEVLAAIEATGVGLAEGASAQQVRLTLRRSGEPLELLVTPVMKRDTDAMGRYYYRPIMGIVRRGGWAEGAVIRRSYGIVAASSKAGRETLLLTRATVTQIGRILSGKVAPQESIGGPVEIVRQASEAAKEGWFYTVRLLGMISISVGIFNLLPVPLLDGGTLMFLVIEAVRGRAVSPLFREKAQIAGFMLLVALMLFVLVMDIGRLFKGG